MGQRESATLEKIDVELIRDAIIDFPRGRITTASSGEVIFGVRVILLPHNDKHNDVMDPVEFMLRMAVTRFQTDKHKAIKNSEFIAALKEAEFPKVATTWDADKKEFRQRLASQHPDIEALYAKHDGSKRTSQKKLLSTS